MRSFSVSIQFNGGIDCDAAIEDLRRLKMLGVPREQLIETFGYSGLDRYEKLLAERQPKLIEATAAEVLPAGAIEEAT
jgi:hypothetical protein